MIGVSNSNKRDKSSCLLLSRLPLDQQQTRGLWATTNWSQEQGEEGGKGVK